MRPLAIAAVSVPVAAIAVAGCRSAGTPRDPGLPAPDSGLAVTWPRTVAEAVRLKLRTMPESEKASIRRTPRDRVQDHYHGFQMLYRADFGLAEGNDALLLSCGSTTMTAEDCMRIILDALWLALQPPLQPPRPLEPSDGRMTP